MDQGTLQPKNSNKNMIIISVAVIAIIFVAIAGIAAAKMKSNDDDKLEPVKVSTDAARTADSTQANSTAEQAQTTPSTDTTTGANADTLTASYKDGSYTATGNYQSPEGSETIDVALTVKGDTITDVTVTGNSKSRESRVYQNKFIGGVKDTVVGKKLGTIKLDRVAGSSLTPKGFNDAIAKIQAQAKG